MVKRAADWLENSGNRRSTPAARGRLLPALLALLLVASFATLAPAGDQTRLYDAKGRYQGRATTNTANPGQKNLYDPHGRYVGRVMTDDNGNTRVYDAHGRYQGRATQRPAQSTSQ
ncbi:hypothetical protein DVDV_1982 [Desulfovibrio sp. DV]|uniref:hypothetical protein n=1 Tax=Desulfovibrio sp. DV TaxID=1844708 RepID=UPI00094BA28A|nr:hypothetical protein [Desulfovibrio sp. DV]OLN27728.1 hypothetical protein DVDV_1982 [Desulfovibrio sp. DV]